MKSIYYGQLDLNKLGQIVRKHNTLVKKANFKDGEHQLININILLRNEPDRFGNEACVKASCKKDEQMDGLNYFIGDLKTSGQDEQPRKPSFDEPIQPLFGNDDMPF